MGHDAVSIQRQLFDQRTFEMDAADGTRDQIFTVFVEQTKNAILGVRHFKRQLQNGIKGLLEP